MYAYIRVCIDICICIEIYVSICVYIYIHVHVNHINMDLLEPIMGGLASSLASFEASVDCKAPRTVTSASLD